MKSHVIVLLLFSTICPYIATESDDYENILMDLNGDEEEDMETDNPSNFDELMEYLDLIRKNNQNQKYPIHRNEGVSSGGKTRIKRITTADAERCNSAACVRELLKRYNKSCTLMKHIRHLSEWNYSVNITKENAKKKTEATLKCSAEKDRNVEIFKIIKNKDIAGLSAGENRMLKAIVTTASPFNKTIVREHSNVLNKISNIYSTGKVMYNGKPLVAGETGVVDFFTKSRNCSALTEVWKGWRDATGKKIRPYFQEMIKLLNYGAHKNGYSDYGYYEWISDFEQKDFNHQVMDLYHQLSPHYKELHAYVRYKLKKFYPNCIDSKGPIPAQLTGNVWAQQFTTIFDIVKPYPKVHNADVSSALKSNGWTVMKMFKAAETFFKSIGLFSMTSKFWKYSVLKKPKHRNISCHGSANDMYSFGDFRIKMCTSLTEQDFTTVHHEMGHIEYFMSYEKQPCKFRNGANSGFHEAIGDTIALSAGSNSHLQYSKLLKNFKSSKEAEINTLLYAALQKLTFIPFGLLVDIWRWRVFNGTITPENYNKEWWKLREQLQGLKPPIKRTEEDFDPGSKFHVALNVPYIRYFFSFIAQFQFYEAMCNASDHQGPLFKCDFYQSKNAGQLLKSMLSLGSSKPWPEAMKLMTGQSELKVDSFVRYFQPLLDWLKEYRLKEKYAIGW